MRLTNRTHLHNPVDQVWDGFGVDLFKALVPPLGRHRVVTFDGMSKGDKVKLNIQFLGLNEDWDGQITECGREAGRKYWFVDVGVRLPPPLKEWQHLHEIEKDGHGTVIIDTVDFSCGNLVLDCMTWLGLRVYFWYRIVKTKKFYA